MCLYKRTTYEALGAIFFICIKKNHAAEISPHSTCTHPLAVLTPVVTNY